MAAFLCYCNTGLKISGGKMKILFEDQDILVVYKEAGLAVQSRSCAEMDLESMLRNYLAAESAQPQLPELYVIHRLDQPVDGLVVFAKSKSAAANLSKQLTDGLMKKIYRAKVSSAIPREEDTLTDYLVKDVKSNITRVVSENEMKQLTAGKKSHGSSAPKKAVLHYKKETEDTVEIELFTGRHHQIRAQLAHAGMPICGDVKYGGRAVPGAGIALTACRLTFSHPRTGKSLTFRVP